MRAAFIRDGGEFEGYIAGFDVSFSFRPGSAADAHSLETLDILAASPEKKCELARSKVVAIYIGPEREPVMTSEIKPDKINIDVLNQMCSIILGLDIGDLNPAWSEEKKTEFARVLYRMRVSRDAADVSVNSLRKGDASKN